jgi:translation initiation factor IF-3
LEDNRFLGEKYKINRAITAHQVRLINQNGDAVGVISLEEALKLANEAGLDLIEVAGQATPPVCKISNYGKLKYELQKKKSEAKKKQKTIEIKEVKFTPVIGDHDYKVKLGSIIKFINDGNKVKVTLRFRGREISHQEIGAKLLARLMEDVKETAKCDGAPQLEGRQMLLMLSPAVAPK